MVLVENEGFWLLIKVAEVKQATFSPSLKIVFNNISTSYKYQATAFLSVKANFLANIRVISAWSLATSWCSTKLLHIELLNDLEFASLFVKPQYDNLSDDFNS